MVTDKKVLQEGPLVMMRIPATPAPRGGYWALSMTDSTNRWYAWRIDDDDQGPGLAIDAPTVSTTGPSLSGSDIDGAQISFSSTGRFLVVHTRAMGALIYRFDANRGQLDYLTSVGNNAWPSYGAMFSPNERYLFRVNSPEEGSVGELQQINVSSITHGTNEPIETYVHGRVATLDSYRDWYNGIGMLWLAPDCRMYVDPLQANINLHIVMHPDRWGADAVAIFNAAEAPTRMASSFATMPNYRYFGCDSTIAPLAGIMVAAQEPAVGDETVLSLAPNPAADGVWVRVGRLTEVITVTDVAGRQRFQTRVGGVERLYLDIGSLEAGVYVVRDEAGRAARLVVQR